MAEPPSSSSGFLTLVNESLSFHPERAELWMTRFDVLRSLGYKQPFADTLAQAAASPKIRKQLDWNALRRMWEQLAPGERFPTDAEERVGADAGVPAPESMDAFTSTASRRPAANPNVRRRFNDVASKLAGTELAVLAKAYNAIALQPGFLDDFSRKTRALLQRPTPLEFSGPLSHAAGTGMRVYLKREDRRGVPVEMEHAAAQCYIGARLGKTGIVTASDVDLHALETVTAASFFGLKCAVVVRAADLAAKTGMVQDLQALGAQVGAMPATGMLTDDPREGALRFWQRNPGSHLVLSLGMAPAPYPAMANAFQSLLGREAEQQYTGMAAMLNRPRTVVAAIGSEADSLGYVLPFLNRRDVRIALAEPEPGGIEAWRPSERFKPYNGQIREHSWLRGVGRIQHVPVPDAAARASREQLAREGVRVSLEDARAVALTAILADGDPTPRDFMVLAG